MTARDELATALRIAANDAHADRMGASQYALNWMRSRAQQVREGN